MRRLLLPTLLLATTALLTTTACGTSTSGPPSAEVRDSPSAVETPAVPVGSPPAAAYVDGRDLVTPDGGRLPLRLPLEGEWGISAIARDGSDYLVVDDRWFEGTVGMHRVDATGRVLDSWATTGPALVGPDGTPAWVSLVAPESGETGPTVIHLGGRSQELAGQFEPRLTDRDGARVMYTAMVLRPDGRAVRRGFETDLVSSPRRVPAPRVDTTSPDLAHSWSWRDDGLAVTTTEGVVTGVVPQLRPVHAGPVWEDDRHLLVTMVAGERQALARVSLDGRPTRTTSWTDVTPAGHAVLE